ncbi:MAG: GNAT family N-acetyltransferase [Myxococcaceae bacterium]
MSAATRDALNSASLEQLCAHLEACDPTFVPPLSQRVDIAAYSQKLVARAERLEVWSAETLVGLVAMYCNDLQSRVAFISSVSVLPAWTRRGLAHRLVVRAIALAKQHSMVRLDLEVATENIAAIRLYASAGFTVASMASGVKVLSLPLTLGSRG